jgi:hypothetical protein
LILESDGPQLSSHKPAGSGWNGTRLNLAARGHRLPCGGPSRCPRQHHSHRRQRAREPMFGSAHRARRLAKAALSATPLVAPSRRDVHQRLPSGTWEQLPSSCVAVPIDLGLAAGEVRCAVRWSEGSSRMDKATATSTVDRPAACESCALRAGVRWGALGGDIG